MVTIYLHSKIRYNGYQSVSLSSQNHFKWFSRVQGNDAEPSEVGDEVKINTEENKLSNEINPHVLYI